jgi:hypothetical protein
MIKGLSWIVMVLSMMAIPYTWDADLASSFIATIYFLIVIGLCINNIKKNK